MSCVARWWWFILFVKPERMLRIFVLRVRADTLKNPVVSPGEGGSIFLLRGAPPWGVEVLSQHQYVRPGEHNSAGAIICSCVIPTSGSTLAALGEKNISQLLRSCDDVAQCYW